MELSIPFARSVINEAMSNNLIETRDIIAVREACRDDVYAAQLARFCSLTERRLREIIDEGITSVQDAHARQLNRRLRSH